MRKILVAIVTLMLVGIAPARAETPPTNCAGPGCFYYVATENTWQNVLPTGSSDRIQLIPGGKGFLIRCWIEGHNEVIWYWGRRVGQWGYVDGDYLDIPGHELAPGVPHC